MFKVLENLLNKPDDIKVRSLPKTNKSVQEKVLAHKPAIKFLETAGFDFSKPDVAEVQDYNAILFQEAMDEINAHIVSLGGKVEVQGAFDPTKASRSNAMGDKYNKPPGLSAEEEDKYDPTKVQSMIDFIKRERESQLEGKIEDRNMRILNAQKDGSSLKRMLMEIDESDFAALKQKNLTDPSKLEKA